MSASGSRDTFLNDAFIRGATNFMHSKVLNQDCNVMNITNRGASYQYIPGAEVHKSHNFAIGLSGLDLSSPDAFAYSLGRSMLSAAASAGMGMLASEAGLGGFVSSLAASLAGSYINSEVMPQRNPSDASGRRSSSSASGQRNSSDASANPNWKLPPLSSNSSVEFDHNGSGFHAVNIDFNRKAFDNFIHQVKTSVIGRCLDEGVEPKEAVKRIKILGEYAENRYREEIDAGATPKEAAENAKKDLPVAEEMVKIDQEIRKNAPTESGAADTLKSKPKQKSSGKSNSSGLKASAQPPMDSDSISLALNRWAYRKSDDAKIKAAKLVTLLKMAACSQDPTPENQGMLERAMNKLKDVSSAAINGLCTILGAPQKAKAMPAAAIAYPIIADIGIFLVENPDFWNRAAQTGASLLNLFNALESKSGDFSLFRSSSKSKPVVSSLSKPTSGSSGPSAQPPEGDDEKDPKKSRIQRTAENVINYFKKLKQEGWEFLGRNGEKRAYINRQTKEIRYNDDTHNEIECFDSSRRHSVRDPITNQLLDKPQHQFPNWLKRLL